MRDVAKVAGVSAATASRALRDQSLVRVKTRERIQRVARQLGYVPDAAARSLVSRRSRTIGVPSALLQDYPFSDILRGVVAGANEKGYGIALVGTHGQNTEEHFDEVVRAHREKRIDGYISYLEGPGAARWSRSEIPCVSVESYGQLKMPVVHQDRVTAGYDLTEHLLGLGHRRVAMLGLDQPSFGPLVEGYRRAHAARGMAIQPELILQYPGYETLGIDPNTPEGYGRHVEAGVRLAMSMVDRPTAVVFHYTMRAMFAIKAFKSLGLRVPDDVAIAGLADQPGSYNTDPSITVWQSDYTEIGRRGAIRLIERIEGTRPEDKDMEIQIPGQLIVRESSGKKKE